MFRNLFAARTSNWCSVSGSSGPAKNGEVQLTHGDPLTEHWKVASGSWLEENSKVADLRLVWMPGMESSRSSGPEVIVVLGSPTTVQVYSAGVGSVFGTSARSMARTWIVCWPDERPVSSYMASHASHAPLSSLHSNSSTCSLAEKPKITSGPEGEGGLDSMVVFGPTSTSGSTGSAKNSNVAVLSVVSESGPSSITVSGAVTSTTLKVRFAGVGSRLPASSIAATSMVCSPSVSTSNSSCDSHDPSDSPSRKHSNSRSSGAVLSSLPVNSRVW